MTEIIPVKTVLCNKCHALTTRRTAFIGKTTFYCEGIPEHEIELTICRVCLDTPLSLPGWLVREGVKKQMFEEFNQLNPV